MKILLKYIQNIYLYKFVSCCRTKNEDIVKNVVNQTVDGAIHFHNMEKKYYGSQWLPSTVWLPIFFRISYFAVNRRKKLIQIWNNLRESK